MIYLATLLAVFFVVVSVVFVLALRKIMPLTVYFILIGTVTIIGVSGYYISTGSRAVDTQVLSGQVTDKKKQKVSCRHSYKCFCYQSCSGTGSNRSCHEVCQTCYEHSHDFDWDVNTTIGQYTIDTIDRQGKKEPPRWTQVQVGDPVSTTSWYQNWIKAVPTSVFRNVTHVKDVPEYPITIYDYYKINRVVVDKVNIPAAELAKLNQSISEGLKTVAGQKQVNLVIVLTNRAQPFVQDLKTAWLGGKKNDLVVVIGSKTYPTIDWVDVFGWSKDQMVLVSTRNEIKDHGVIDHKVVDISIENIQKYWNRKPMSDYSYLEKEIEPGFWGTAITVLLAILACGGWIYYFITNPLIERRY